VTTEPPAEPIPLPELLGFSLHASWEHIAEHAQALAAQSQVAIGETEASLQERLRALFADWDGRDAFVYGATVGFSLAQTLQRTQS
jgi:hypothetical protein